MQSDIVEKFTTHLKNVLTKALSFAAETNQDQIMPEHLLWALATQKGCIGAEIMSKSKIKSDRLRTLIEKSSTGVKPSPDQDTLTVPVLSDDAKRVIEKAVLTANIYEHRYVGTEHLLSGLLQVKNRPIKDFFAKEKIDTKQLNEQIAVVLKSTSKFPEFTDTIDELEEELPLGVTIKDTPEPSVLKETSNKTPALDYFARDLTSEEVQQNIDPVIARDDEIQRVMEILCRRTKNNPVLLGEPGVGKTAIAEGLAKRILEDDVPPILQGKRIMALDMSLVIAGTMYRGEFEERLRQVIEEVRGNANIILFIDELHTIMGTGASAGSLDAANILKPSLARGDIRCIGATTTAEFKKNIESDAALERRFQPVIIKEPSAEDTQAILQGICKNYERFHNVEISEAAIQAAVDLSIRYIPDKYLPDKAIDLIDEAAAAHRVADTSSEITSRLLELEREIKRVQQDKRQAIVEERFKDAIKIKEVEEKKAKLLTKLHQEERAQGLIGTVEEADVARVVSRMTGVPLDDLSQGASKKLLGLEKTLSKHVLGQETTIQTVADAMRRAKAGINHPERPLASFLFIGPSGVGKTELAHTIAKELFGGSDDLIRLDMSEYAEGFTVSKLIGAPAGYVGYRENAKLTDRVKQRPYCVVLFDELEKAHSDVQNLLLQILENGELSDATGRPINFRNTIVVMTSNVGLEKFMNGGIGFAGNDSDRSEQLLDDVRSELEERFRPEMLNRIDNVCLFKTLDQTTLKAITEKQLNELTARLDKNNVKISYNSKVVDYIVYQIKDSKTGARSIRQIISRDVEAAIADRLLKRPEAKTLKILVIKNKIAVQAMKT